MGLQFSWIEANLLGFFLEDVRNSRGKFDEIKEKFMINPASIASQSSLEIFLESRLIPSWIDQKLRTKKGITSVLKRKIGPKIVANWSGRGGWFMDSWERFLGAMSWLQFPSQLASISLPNSHHFSHDRATIVVLVVRRSPSARMAAIPPR